MKNLSLIEAPEVDLAEKLDKEDEENDTSDTSDNLQSEIRADQTFLILSDSGPLKMTKDKDDAIAILKVVKSRNRKAVIIDLNAKPGRLHELGTNLFKCKITEDIRKNMLSIRNSIIKYYLDFESDNSDLPEQLVWKRVARNNKIDITDHPSYAEWNQWALDVIEYSQYNTKFNLG